MLEYYMCSKNTSNKQCFIVNALWSIYDGGGGASLRQTQIIHATHFSCLRCRVLKHLPRKVFLPSKRTLCFYVK